MRVSSFRRNSLSRRAVVLRGCCTLSAHKSDGDPRDEIVRLEAHIEELAAKIEICRKFILASRIAIAGGGIALAAMFLAQSGSIRPRWRPRSRLCSAALSCGFKRQHRTGSGEGIGSG